MRAKLNQLESIKKKKHLITLLSLQPNFQRFLNAIVNTVGASLHVFEDGETAPAINGKPISEYKKRRFQDEDELRMLLNMAGLHENN